MILLIFVGRRLERKFIFIAGFISLASLVLDFFSGVLYITLGDALEQVLVVAGVDMHVAIALSIILVQNLPSAVLSVLFAVCLIKDASRNEIVIAIPIIALALIVSGIAYGFVRIWLDWLMISTFGIPFGVGSSVLWGVYFILVRNSLRNTPAATSTLEKTSYP